MAKLLRTMLYSSSYPGGFLHDGISSAEEQEMLASGEWFDHPAKVPGAPPEASNSTGGFTNTRGTRSAPVRYSEDDLRAMFLTGKDMSVSMLARLATALQLRPEAGTDEAGLRELIEEALHEDEPVAQPAPAKKAEPKTSKPAPLAPAKKAPAKKAAAKK